MRIVIRVEGAQRRPIRKMQLESGTRVSDLIQLLKLRGDYVLALASDPTHPLPQEAAVDGLLADGEHLVARLRLAPFENAAPFTLTAAN